MGSTSGRLPLKKKSGASKGQVGLHMAVLSMPLQAEGPRESRGYRYKVVLGLRW